MNVYKSILEYRFTYFISYVVRIKISKKLILQAKENKYSAVLVVVWMDGTLAFVVRTLQRHASF